MRLRSILARCVLACCVGSAVSCRTNSVPGRAYAIPQSVVAAFKTSAESSYLLVLVDGEPLPERDGEVGQGGCTANVQSGWYRLSGNEWQSFDSVTTTCSRTNRPALASRRRSGTIKHAGDTLVFSGYDRKLRAYVVADRGLLRGDTLRTGGLLFDGPPRVYLRRKMPSE